MFSSSAAMPGSVSRRAASAAKSSGLCPAMLMITGARSVRSSGRYVAMYASMPGFSSPMEFRRPPGVSTRRRGALPARGSVVIVLTTTAPRRETS
jgi:hypothetical protein